MKDRRFKEALKLTKIGLTLVQYEDLYVGEYLSVILESLKGLAESSFGGKQDRNQLEKKKTLR